MHKSYRISYPAACLIVALCSSPVFALDVFAGMGYENRGVSGQAETLYAGEDAELVPVTIRSNLAFDLHSVQLEQDQYLDFRSAMLEVGTGSFLPGPFDFRLRYQFERFSRSNASLVSIVPLVNFDSRYFFSSLGYNFRTFSMDDGNPFNPYFSILEKEIAIAIGGRCWPRENLSLSLSINNFDEFSAESFAALGYQADVNLILLPWTIQAIFAYHPSGATALAATPSSFIFRLCTRMKL